MRGKHRIGALLLALLLMGTMALPAGAAELPQHFDGALVIIHTNDLHGNLDSYAKVAAMKQTYEDYGAYVLLLDAGDYSGGQPWVEMSEGESAVTLMNMAGYGGAAVGEEELAYGYAQLQTLADLAEFPLLAANAEEDGGQALAARQVFTMPDGMKIGVFGLTAPEAAVSAGGAVTFSGGSRLAACAQEQADALRAEGCQVVICLGHLDMAGTGDGNSAMEVIRATEGIDLFINGHAHYTLEEIKAANGGTCVVGDTVLTSAGTDFQEVGIVVYTQGEYAAVSMSSQEVVVLDEAVQAKGEELSRAVCGGYGDVTASQWFAPAVRYVTEAGLMQGSGGLFRPNEAMSRAMLVTVLYRLAGSPAVDGEIPFADVAPGKWYADAVCWAAEQGIVQGVTPTAFSPDGQVTREQMATFLYRYAGAPESSGTLSGYTDAGQVGAYAADAMAWAVAEGLITGTTASTLSPRAAATRAAVAVVLTRWAEGE